MPDIARAYQGQFLLLFLLLFSLTLGLVVWYEVRHETGDDGWDTTIAIGIGMSYCIVISTAMSYVIVEGVNMLAEQFKQKRYAEAQAKGEAKGEANRQKVWEEWNGRRQEAEARGEAFNEPPPTLEKRE